MTTDTRPWVIYARAADAGPLVGRSGLPYALESQIELCRKFLPLGQQEIVIAEVGSGLSRGLPGMRRLLALARAGEIAAVVVSHPDRISRDRHLLKLRETELEQCGVQVRRLDAVRAAVPHRWLSWR